MFPFSGISGAAVGAFGLFPMRSIRLGTGSQWLSRTAVAPTNNQKWTYSLWFKPMYQDAAQLMGLLEAGGAAYGAVKLRMGGSDLEVLHLFDFNAGFNWQLITTQQFRDPTAWTHLCVAVDTTQATAANRVLVYINGTQLTAFSTATYPAQNSNTFINNSGTAHAIGRFPAGASDGYFGYLADAVFVDGQQLPPSTFVSLSDLDSNLNSYRTVQPKPIPTTGLTLGNNGFWLSFDNNTTAASLAFDDGTGARGAHAGAHDWVNNNIGAGPPTAATSGGGDSMIDVPMAYFNGVSDLRGNFATLDPATTAIVYLRGGLALATGFAGWFYTIPATFSVGRGKWHVQMQADLFAAGGGDSGGLGAMLTKNLWCAQVANAVPNGANGGFCATTNGGTALWINNTTSVGANLSGDIIGLCLDCDGGKGYIGRNRAGAWTWYTAAGAPTGDPVAGINPTFSWSITERIIPVAIAGGNPSTLLWINFGQLPWTVTPPTGYQQMCSALLDAPSIIPPENVFDTSGRMGTVTAGSVTGKLFRPDLVWSKATSGSISWGVADTTRGATKQLLLDQTAVEATDVQGLTAFNSDGFSWGTTQGVFNFNTIAYIDYLFKKQAPFLDVVTYTGDGTFNRDIPHNLGVVPRMAIVRNRTTALSNWFMWHVDMTGPDYYIFLNSAAAGQTNANSPWGAGSWTASTFRVSANSINGNLSGANYIAYLFADVAGFCRVSSYQGNGSYSGPGVYTGFLPRFVLGRANSSTNSWIVDSQANLSNPRGISLLPSSNAGYFTGANLLDFFASGFRPRTTNNAFNINNTPIWFLAIANNPFKFARGNSR